MLFRSVSQSRYFDSLNNYQAHLPSFNIIDAAKGLIDNSTRNIFGLPLSNDRVRLFDMLGYGLNLSNYQKFVTVPDCFNVNPFRFLAYQKVYFDHYRNPLYELNDPSLAGIIPSTLMLSLVPLHSHMQSFHRPSSIAPFSSHRIEYQ